MVSIILVKYQHLATRANLEKITQQIMGPIRNGIALKLFQMETKLVAIHIVRHRAQ